MQLRTISRSRTSSLTEESDPRISNRELWGLEILQLTENKRQRPLLIANFESNHRSAFYAYVAAAFRRAAFLPQFPGKMRESGRRKGHRK
jgi:hypothetical protein